MSVIFKSKASVMRLISLINGHTGTLKENLTDAVAELIRKSEKGYNLVSSICSGTVEELRAEDFGPITSIIGYLFSYNENLRYVELPEGLTSLGSNCFQSCYNLTMPSLPEGIGVIPMSAFYNCSSLVLTKLPDMLTKIDNSAFSGCVNLRISEIPAGVTSIGRAAFSGCTAIEAITFRGTPASIDRSIFANCTNLREVNVPWAEGAVANAPWGATNATVNYNCGV